MGSKLEGVAEMEEGENLEVFLWWLADGFKGKNGEERRRELNKVGFQYFLFGTHCFSVRVSKLFLCFWASPLSSF